MSLESKIVMLRIYKGILCRLIKDIEPHLGESGIAICLNVAYTIQLMDALIREISRRPKRPGGC
jgi:hypothetical protein